MPDTFLVAVLLRVILRTNAVTGSNQLEEPPQNGSIFVSLIRKQRVFVKLGSMTGHSPSVFIAPARDLDLMYGTDSPNSTSNRLAPFHVIRAELVPDDGDVP
jgi:hypothetical protein